jgi:hypothetical protein
MNMDMILQQGSKANSGVKKLVATNTAAFKMDELFRNGFLRTLVSFCLHRIYAVRQLAYQIITFLLESAYAIHEKEKGNTGISLSSAGNSNYLNQLWSSTIEQGIIIMLEYISQGIVINDFPNPPSDLPPSQPYQQTADTMNEENEYENHPTTASIPKSEAISSQCKHLFPESSVRSLARRYLHLVGECLHDENALCKKLFSSLTFSGNHKLRLNIFMGMLFLSARNTSKKFLAIHSLPNGLNTMIEAPLLSMTNDFVKDIPEMKKLLKGLYHLVHYAWRYQETLMQYEANIALQDTSIATQTESKHARGILGEAIQRIQPIVLVGSTANQAIRMVCPSITIITNHCPQLAQAILVSISSLFSCCYGLNPDYI